MLNQLLIQDVLNEGLSLGADFAEIFVENTQTQTLIMVGSKLDKANKGQDFGIGIRLLQGFQSVYGYTNDASRESLLKTARTLAQALAAKTPVTAQPLIPFRTLNRHLAEFDLNQLPASRRVEKMRQVSEVMKNHHPAINQATVNLMEKRQDVLIANTEGLLSEDSRTYTRMAMTAVAANGSEMQTGSHGPGAHQGFEFIENLDTDFLAEDAARQAVAMLHAGHAPSGKFPVVIDNGFGGVIFHEACGHGLEATSVAKNISVFSNRLGEQVANPAVTAIDDGTIKNAWGSLNIDDEGTPTQKNVLIENGILKSYLVDKLNDRRMNHGLTGSSRRQNYRLAPTSRMNNTYIANGPHSPESIIANTEFGIYAKYMGGGSVNTATGDFNFAVREGYMIRDGKVCEPVRGATLIGNGPDILHKIDLVGNNLAYAQGVCGSVSGHIPTDIGQPTLRVTEITVGGTN